jgi:hypothetical protein
MNVQKKPFEKLTRLALLLLCPIAGATLLLLGSCDKDPEPVNEEEVITTMTITLTPTGGGNAVELKFYDQDGATGSIVPQITVSRALAADATYTGAITLLNETVNPADNITGEVEEEAEDHLFCFEVTGANLTIGYADTDSNGRPIGLTSMWTTTSASSGKVKVTLRHQPGVKTGTCPGGGDTDVEVEFEIAIQ